MSFTTVALILLLVLLVALMLALAYIVQMLKKQNTAAPDSALLLLQGQMNDMSRSIESRLNEWQKLSQEQLKNQGDSLFQHLSESNKMIQGVSAESNKLIKDITSSVTKLDETNKQVVGFADQLKSLQDILKNPKQRGVLGEYYLEALLKNVLPPGSYQMQYGFKDGEIVDAIVRVKDKIIPIDSKFSLENYNRLAEEKNESEKIRLEKLYVNDLKLRIQETSKYIRPAEGTMDFAFMFIPHEAIYYDLLVNKIGAINEDTDNLIQRAANKYKVIIVSPTSFLAYLQTVLQGLKAMQIEEQAKDIVQRIGELNKHLKAYEEYHKKIGGSLGTLVNHFNASNKEFQKIDKDVLRISGEKMGIEPLLIEKPDEDAGN
jgi:DNA recombination protein RmuC